MPFSRSPGVLAALLLTSISCPIHAATSVAGRVTDAGGKPIRGAIVKVEEGGRLTARYTDEEGRYRVAGLAAQQRKKIVVTAFGFAPATVQTDDDKANFKLTARMDLATLNTSELRYLIAEDDKTQRRVYYECGNCHGLELIVSRAGMPKAAWETFLPHMVRYRWGWDENYYSQEELALFAAWVTPMFGPQGILSPRSNPDYSKVKHTPIKDAALDATIIEYAVPSAGAQPHSIRVDAKSGMVWFGNYDSQSNNIYRFNPQTASFQEFKIPLKNAAAHTGTVLKDGGFIVGLDRRKNSPLKFALVDANDKVQMVEFSARPRGGRVVTRDPTDEDVVWAVSGSEIWRMNLRTNERRVFQNPKPSTLPAGSFASEYAMPGDQPQGGGYDVVVDSKGMAWVSQMMQAVIFSIDPQSGATKMYHTPQMTSTRGIIVDPADNVWFADYYGHKLGKLDPKTGRVTLFQPPNKYGSPYGLALDAKRGYLWYADTMPNNVTRFDLRTNEFVEFPLPTAGAAVRFVDIDSEGRVWYGGFGNSRLGVVDPGY